MQSRVERRQQMFKRLGFRCALADNQSLDSESHSYVYLGAIVWHGRSIRRVGCLEQMVLVELVEHYLALVFCC